MKKHTRGVDTIIVHCSATNPQQDISAADIRRWHLQRGWDDIGYHYVIRRNGVVEQGRDPEFIGAHARGRNDGSIGVCLVGGVNSELKPDANFTMEQYRSLLRLIGQIKQTWAHPLLTEVPEISVHGHRDFSSKACPCFDIHSLLMGSEKPITIAADRSGPAIEDSDADQVIRKNLKKFFMRHRILLEIQDIKALCDD